MSSDEIADVMKEVTLYDKPGHRKRFVSALQILCSKDKHGVPDGEKTICTTIMSSASCNVSSCKSALNCNIFELVLLPFYIANRILVVILNSSAQALGIHT